MNPRSTPRWVLGHHSEYQIADFLCELIPASSFSRSGDQAPVQAEARAMPADHGLGSDDDESLLPSGPEPARRWLAFLHNHREAIAAMDFFTVPTVTFSLLYCFFVIHHDRRRILHFNVTCHPTSAWIVQQLREAFPYQSGPRFLVFDHDAKYGLDVPATIRSLNFTCFQTALQSPWQNGVAERWVGTCRRELLDHIIALNERHLRRLLSEYVSYYHDDRTHLGLCKQTPGGRIRSVATGHVISSARLGGLHHRYDRAA